MTESRSRARHATRSTLASPASAGSRMDWVDAGRGLAICLVALFHSTNWLYGTGSAFTFWTDLNTVLSSLRMPMFFVLAGLFAGKWLMQPWRSLLRSKVLLFLWVLAVWSVVDMVVQLAGMATAGQQVSLTTAAKDLLLSPVKPLFELWFVWALALFFIVAKLTRRLPIWVQMGVSGVLACVGLTIWLTTTTGLTGSAKFYFFFLAGIYFRQAFIAFAQSRLWIHLAVLAGWASMSLTLFVLDLRGLPGVYFLNCIAGVFGGIALAQLLVKLPVLQRLGRNTLPIYLAHTPLAITITIVIMLVPSVHAAVPSVTLLLPPLVAAVAIAAALGLHRLLRKGPLKFLYEPPAWTQKALRLTPR